MRHPYRPQFFIAAALAVFALSGCAPEPGSDAWCEEMAEKPKGDWTLNDAAEFAKSCVVKIKIKADS